jgi:hypothetical protein
MLVPTPIYHIHNNQLNNRKPSQMAQHIECAVAPYFQAEKICISIGILEEKLEKLGSCLKHNKIPPSGKKLPFVGHEPKPIRQLPHKFHVIDLNHPYIFLCLKINQDLWKLEIGKWELHPSHDTTTCG